MLLVRTGGELDYLEGLHAIPNAVLEDRHGQSIVANEPWVRPRAQILAQFRFVKKRGVYWNTFLKNERRLQNR